MTIEIIVAVATFAFVGSITPGPNNFMLLASGLNFGFRRTIPHLLGVGFGFGFMMLAVGFGIGGFFSAFPSSYTILKIAGAAYLLYLAWRIALGGTTKPAAAATARPMSFLEAAAFQWLNPKGWVLALGAVAAYSRPGFIGSDVPIIAAIFLLANLPCVAVWAAFGTWLQRLLGDERRVAILNWVMGILLALSVVPILLG